jgi:sugar phosphate isomerase/epimerase
MASDKNLATSPAIWQRMFSDIQSASFGLNFDPSHFVWQGMDYLEPMREFREKLFHVHAKDARLDHSRLNRVGLLAHPNEYHTPKLPGLGDVDWSCFFRCCPRCTRARCVSKWKTALNEGPLENRKRALVQSGA